MIRGMYNAATALDAAMQHQEIVADNLAHLATPGHRARGVSFESLQSTLGPQAKSSHGSALNSAGVRTAGIYTNFQPGAMRPTGDPYHFAIEGDGFFALEGPNGTVYSRNGTFHVNADGQLLSSSNYPVLGTSGPITIPSDARRVTMARDGTIYADSAQVGQLQVTRFADNSRLEQVGPTLYRSTPEAGESTGDASVMQGFLETSNTNAASSMVEMIQAARFFETAQRALRSIAETLQLNTRPTA